MTYVRQFSNLIANGCWESANHVLGAKQALGAVINFNSLEQMPSSIYKIGKARRRFFDGPQVRGGYKGRILNQSDELHPGWQENTWRPLFTDASQIRDG